jgi:hypothetical protein
MLLILPIIGAVLGGFRLWPLLPWWLTVLVLIVGVILSYVLIVMIGERLEEREYYALVDDATSHPDGCDCNYCYAAGRWS